MTVIAMPKRTTTAAEPKEAKSKEFKLPKTLAACADMAYSLRQERYAAQKKVDEIKSRETALTEHLINTLPKSDASGVRGKVALAVIKEVDIIELVGAGKVDSDKFELVYEYILKNARKDPGVWSLLQRRVGEAAAKELILAGKGKAIGAKMGKVPTVSLTKV